MKELLLYAVALAALCSIPSPNAAAQVAPPPLDPATKPMAADADPAFEVATIRPSDPNHPIDGTPIGHRIVFPSTTLAFLASLVYDVHDKQIIGAPDWMKSEKFDFEGVSDTPGTPDLQQLKIMFRKLLADRFQLKFHHETRELSAYVLTLEKNGPKFSKSADDPHAPSSLLGRPQLGMKGRNLTMADFAHLLQNGVLDRPVVDRTHLQGKYDFLLKWTPDESQFTQAGARITPPSDTAELPGLFKAVQEQLGLKLVAAKTQVDVLAIDHVEKPSEN